MIEDVRIWVLLWKTLFIGTLLLFGGMSVWVIWGGWIDIQHLFRDLSGPRDPLGTRDPGSMTPPDESCTK